MMQKKKKITIKDVAQAAGVSTQTVSRVINNRPDVLPQTRARVQKAVAELDYAPNIIARSLSRGRSNTLGIVGFGLQYFGSTSILTGIEHKINELGYSLLLSLLDKFEPTRIDAILENLLSRQVEGIIWAVPGQVKMLEWITAKAENLPVPLVYLNKKQFEGHVVVSVNNQQGGRLATQHLVDQGYQRIGIITGPEEWWEAEEREKGWQQVLQEAGLDDDLALLRVTGDWSAASGDIGFHTLYTRCPDLDAVFVSNDQMALGALQAARRLGLRVPQDLGLVGFDDIPEAAYFYPSITTVRQNTEKLGGLAVETINNLIQARQENTPFVQKVFQVEPRLIIRKSSKKDSE
jgi:DNA-binding LacI/PurR family transcriptional regulator